MKKIIALASIILSFVLVNFAHADTAKSVVVVNVQQILQDSPKVSAINKKLQDEFKPRQDKLTEFQKKIQDQVADLNKNDATMSQSNKKTAQDKIDADRTEFLKQANEFQQDLSQAQTKSGKEIFETLNQIIKNIAQKHGYSVVLDSQAVAFAEKDLNITQEVLDALDKS